MIFMPEMNFEGTATWKGGTECELTVKDKKIATVYCVPEEIFAAALASCMNTLFLLIARNSSLSLKNFDTKAIVTMNVESLEKLIFTHIHFAMNVKLETDNEHERKKTNMVYQMAEKICPLRQSWGEDVPISFERNFLENCKPKNSFLKPPHF
jgi:organic hydroperoxide reductase OsmC/OhrA